MRGLGGAERVGTRAVAVAGAVLLVAATLVGTFVGAPPASAAGTITVTTTADVTDPNDGLISLREAVALSNSQAGDDTIVLAVDATYSLTQCPAGGGPNPGPLAFTAAAAKVTIEGNGSTVRQECAPYRAAGIATLRTTNVSLTLRALVVADAGVALVSDGAFSGTSVVVLEHAAITNATKECVSLPSGVASLTLRFSRIDGCGGAAVLGSWPASSFRFDMADSEVRGAQNTSQSGGPSLGVVMASSATIVRSSIHDNPGGSLFTNASVVTSSHVDRNGGSFAGIYAPASLTATDSTFDENVSTPVPGVTASYAGVLVAGPGSLTRVSVSRNRAKASVGGTAGVFFGQDAQSHQLVVIDSHVDENVVEAQTSGAAQAGIATDTTPSEASTIRGIEVRNSTVNGNQAGDHAGIFSVLPTVVRETTVSGNMITEGGTVQGIAPVAVMERLTMSRSTVSQNTVRHDPSTVLGSAGGVFARYADLDNSTIVGNSGDVGGVTGFFGATLSHVTLADNSGQRARNLQAFGAVTVAATSVSGAASAAPSCLVTATDGTSSSGGYNVIADATCPLTGSAAATDLVNVGDVRLAPLAMSGGSSPTQVPLPQSVLRDRIPVAVGSLCSGVDQRGVVRPQGAGCDVGAVEAEGSLFHAVAPTRILDTRVDVVPGGSGKVVAGVPLKVPVAGGVVPLSAAAVVLNVTVTGSSANSFLTVWPAGSPQPNASAVNFGAGQTIPNLVTAKVGEDGHVVVATNQGATDVVVDLFGWFDDGSGSGVGAGDGWVGVDPVRVLDSRTLTGGWGARLVAGAPRELVVRGVAGIPVDASAVVANVTVTGSSANSFLSLWPAGGARPASSNVNFAVGETIANGVIVPVGAGGKVMVATAVGATDVVVDVTGYFTAAGGSRFFAVGPTRVLDDREGVGAVGPWLPGQTRAVGVTGGPVAANAVGVAANVTVTNGSAGSFLSVFPHGAARPSASSINFGPGQTIANQAMVRVGGGQVDIFNQLGNVDVIADVVGYYAPL